MPESASRKGKRKGSDIGPAQAERLRLSAVRALDDPAQLGRAARIVRAALERKRLTLADVLPADADE